MVKFQEKMLVTYYITHYFQEAFINIGTLKFMSDDY